MIKVYRKTATIKAEQFDGSNEMIAKYHIEFDDAYRCPFRIETLEGWLGVNVHDWIATGVNGEYWPITNDVFKKTYAELPVIPDYVVDRKVIKMKIKDLIHELQKYDGETEVAIYNSSTGNALWIPNYDLNTTISPDDEFAEEYELPSGTVFITCK